MSDDADVSLLDQAKGDDKAEQPVGHPAEIKNPPETKPAETKPEKPQRPEHVPEQFWDADKGEVKVEAMAKSWTDVRAQLSKGVQKPPDKPEGYTLPKIKGLPEGVIKQDDKLLGKLRGAAHAAGVSQGQFEQLAAAYLGELTEHLKANPPQTQEARKAAQDAFVAEQIKSLGATAQAQLDTLESWGKALKTRGLLSESEHQAFRLAAYTADGVRMLHKIRALAGEQAIPIDPAAVPESGSLEDAYALIAKGDDDSKAKARRILEALDKAGLLPSQPRGGVGIKPGR